VIFTKSICITTDRTIWTAIRKEGN